MRILIDIGHPAHVHLFKNFAFILLEKGHDILFTTRDKEVTLQLLDCYNFNYISFGKHYKRIYLKIWGLFKFTYLFARVFKKFKPDMLLSHGSMYAAINSFFWKSPHISFENNGNWEQIRLYLPFTKVVFTPWNIKEDLGDKQIRINTFHEIAYLTPKYFTPNKSIYDFLQLSENEIYCIIRFVSWDATHDSREGGLTIEEKDEIIIYLSEHYKVFISSEGVIPDKYKKYLIRIPPERMHDALFFSSLVISEGATMASEAGVLGTPTIYVNSLERCYNEDQEKFRTVFNFRNGVGVLKKIKEISSYQNLENEMLKRRTKLFNSKIDLTMFLIWFIENYPKSVQIMKENPAYQYNFKI